MEKKKKKPYVKPQIVVREFTKSDSSYVPPYILEIIRQIECERKKVEADPVQRRDLL